MDKRSDIKPAGLYRLFVRQTVQSFAMDGDSIHLTQKNTIITLDLGTVEADLKPM